MGAPALSSDSYSGTRTRVVVITQSGANNGNVDLTIPKAMAAMSFHLEGSYTAGSVTLQVSNDGTNFYACPTATSLSGLGVKNVVDLGYKYYRFAFATMNSANSLTLTAVAKHY